MISDGVVVGIRDKSLSERLQLDADLAPAARMKLERGMRYDVVKKQQKLLEAHNTGSDFAAAGVSNCSRARLSTDQICVWCHRLTRKKILSGLERQFLLTACR